MDYCPVCKLDLALVRNKDAHINLCFENDNGSVDIRSSQEISSKLNSKFDESSFQTIQCVYPKCTSSCDLSYFPTHAIQMHGLDQHKFIPCPICNIFGEYDKAEIQKENLIEHLAECHSELLGIYEGEKIEVTLKKSLTTTTTATITKTTSLSIKKDYYLNLNVQSHSDYIASKVIHDVPDSECSICFGGFEKEDIVARLNCLCLYHQNCIEGWYTTKKKRECPLHTNQ